MTNYGHDDTFQRNFPEVSGLTGVVLSLGFYLPANAEDAEMGQESYQSVPQIIAEELEVNLNEVAIVSAGGDNKKHGRQLSLTLVSV